MDPNDRLKLVLAGIAELGWKNSIDLAATADASTRFSVPGLSADEVHEALKDAAYAGLFAGEPSEGDGSMRTWHRPYLSLSGLQSVGAWPTADRPAVTTRWWDRALAALVHLRDNPPHAGHISGPRGTDEPTSPVPDTDEHTYWLLLSYLLDARLLRAIKQQGSLEEVALTPAGSSVLGSGARGDGPLTSFSAAQRELFDRIAGLAHELPAHDREFLFAHRADPARVVGANNIDFPVVGDDVSQLEKAGLLKWTSQNYVTGLNFVVTPRGFEVYELARRRMADRLAAVERDVLTYLRGDEMAQRFPQAFRLWLQADQQHASRSVNATVVGHTIREAMQMFATELLDRHRVDSSESPTQTVARVRAVINARRDDLGEARSEVLDALLAYWGTVSDLTQRLEHGAQKEGEPVNSEDARQLVYLTAQVMFELSRTLG
ncbi:MAG TPA: hypothetical protein VK501_04545 [Baekduia sp.]|uniref:hypothetical protein n=1 Tax=Baekduia sp. TaxID=2600305 RepID=UPI002CF58076|nr:hypothetical protein [Baekduia sp.]HMJ33167.1 hypothetical protein [Baekduia sp.]